VHGPEGAPISAFALSPDGRHVAFVSSGSPSGTQAGTTKLWLRRIDSLDARAVPGTEGIAFEQHQLFWSPDSEFIAVVTQDGRVKKVSVRGGPPETLASGMTPATRGTWGRDGTILLQRTPGSPLKRVPEVGGAPVDLTTGTGGPRFQPQFLPDGKHYLCVVPGDAGEASGIYVASLADGALGKRLLPDRTVVQYAPSGMSGPGGHLLFVRDGTLMAQPFNADMLASIGSVFTVAESVGRFSVSQTGALAYMAGGARSRQELHWIDRNGTPLGVAAAAGEYRNVRLSPDETKIAYDRIDDQGSDVWVLDLQRGAPTRITFDPQTDNLPIWSPDGGRLLWPSRRGGSFHLYIKPASGAGQDEKFIDMGTINGWGTDWSRDGKFILYQRPGEKTGQDLWIAPQGPDAPGPREPFRYLDSAFNEANGVFSPDGRWIAYESDESGRYEVYVQSFPLTTEKVQISTSGGTNAAWSKTGELFYLAADRNLVAVQYAATATTFKPGAGKTLFPVPGYQTRRTYAVSGDGTRFLIGKVVGEDINEPITWVLNWLHDRNLRVPSK
jgi:Tol biopolymer transport system component